MLLHKEQRSLKVIKFKQFLNFLIKTLKGKELLILWWEQKVKGRKMRKLLFKEYDFPFEKIIFL